MLQLTMVCKLSLQLNYFITSVQEVMICLNVFVCLTDHLSTG